jgi:biopolymer transport protein ExbD
MTPMIDVVFQLLVFFLFTFRIAPIEGEIGVNMPPADMGSSVSQTPPEFEMIPVLLFADDQGELESIKVEDNQVEDSDARGLDNLTALLTAQKADVELAGKEIEIEIDADPRLRYFWVIRGVNAIQRADIDAINFRDPQPKS